MSSVRVKYYLNMNTQGNSACQIAQLLWNSKVHYHLPSGLFPSSFNTKILFAFLVTPMSITLLLGYVFVQQRIVTGVTQHWEAMQQLHATRSLRLTCSKNNGLYGS